MEYDTVYTPDKYRETEGINGDYAKTGYVIPYPEEKKKRIMAAQGGFRAKMPYFFQFSKNGRASGQRCENKKALKDESTMNKICNCFEGRAIKPIKFNFDEVPNFNYKMLLGRPALCDRDICIAFALECKQVDERTAIFFQRDHDEYYDDMSTKQKVIEARLEAKQNLINKFGDPARVYESIVVDLFAGNKIDSKTNKSAFWDMFGQEAYEILKYNLEHCYICDDPNCKMMVPNWDNHHEHQNEDKLHYKCVQCGNIFEFRKQRGTKPIRCDSCNKDYVKNRAEVFKARERLGRLKHVEDNKKCTG